MPRQERPLDEDQGLVVEFARGLRGLRDRAGRPTYRELSLRAHFSISALAEAASGRKLPSLAVTTAFVRACDGDIAEWEARWRDCAAELATPAVEPVDADAPYAGLAPFGRGDADRFFGRDRVVAEVVARVRARRTVAVFGPSGSGKSSVLMAGLLPELDPGCAVVLTPGPRPLEECAVRLAGLVGASPGRLAAEFAEDPRGLHLCVRQAVANRSDEQDLVLVVDQFEELFTLCADAVERAAFVAALTTAATEPTSRTRVVLGVRADFYGHCAEYPELLDVLRDGQVLVGAMTADELRQAITGPAEAVGCRVETALVSRLVADATGQPGALPLVSHALRETWHRRRGTVLTLAAYEATGGIHYALARTADAVYTGLDHDQQHAASQLFLRLTALGEGTDDTKRPVRRDELDQSPATAAVLEQLARARLVTVDEGGIEITHEALIRHWPRLRRWLDDDRDGLRVHRRLTEATQLWEAHDRDHGSLLRGVRLTQAENVDATRLTDREREFLAASVDARDHERATARRRSRRARQLVALLAVLLLIACVSLVVAVRAQDAATAQRNAAVVGSALSDANLLRDTDPALSLQLTLAAYRAGPSARARDALLDALDTPYAGTIESSELSVEASALSPDGALLVTPGAQRTGMWDVTDHDQPKRLPNELPGGEVVAFGPDRILLVKTTFGRYEVWDVRDSRRPRKLTQVAWDDTRGNPYLLRSAVAISRDGRAAVTVDIGGTARLWDLDDRTRPRLQAQLLPAPQSVRHAELADLGHAEFSPRGDRLVVANATHAMHLWDLTGGRARELAVLSGDAAAFTPDGATLAVAGRRGAVELWDIASAGAPRRLATFANQGDVISLAFNDTGLLAVGDLTGSVSLWNVEDRRRPVVLTDLAGRLDGGWSMAFGPRGDTLFAADHGSVRIWDLGPVLVSHPDAVTQVQLNHHGDLLATGGRDHTVRLWRVDGDGSRYLATLALPYTATSLYFSSDDRTLVLDGTGPTQVWDVTRPDRPRHAADLPETAYNGSLALNPVDTTVALSQLVGAGFATKVYDLADPYHPTQVDELAAFPVQALAFDPHGTMLAVARNTDTELWDLRAPVTTRTLAVLPTTYSAVATFGPDGRTVAVFRNDTRQTQLLGLHNPRKPEVLATFHPRVPVDNRFHMVGPPPVYSADGHLLAVVDGDRTIRLWNISNPRNPLAVTAFDFNNQVDALSISADGRQLYVATEENLVHRRYLDVDDVANRICTLAHPTISEADWRAHFNDLPYDPPCQ
ncbi:MAG TPA: WD40 repeat domain-containing protein [Actinophytocola sp.]|uniref:WD40 repeat domain-containing protein n=1 Tax=Actinophytocola sp. TaxID=1872138 RepID=UPI002F91ECBF